VYALVDSPQDLVYTPNMAQSRTSRSPSPSSVGPVPVLDQILIDTRTGRTQPVTIDGTHLTDSRGGEYRIDVISKLPYDFEEFPFMITCIAMYKVMFRKRVRGEARNVMDWLTAYIETGNIVKGFYLREIAKETGIHLSNVSHALVKLERLDLIQRRTHGRVYLNPKYMFVGNSAYQRKAVEEWNQWRRDNPLAEAQELVTA
jgi:hypothetical protein